jgi:hypothetical protein
MLRMALNVLADGKPRNAGAVLEGARALDSAKAGTKAESIYRSYWSAWRRRR